MSDARVPIPTPITIDEDDQFRVQWTSNERYIRNQQSNAKDKKFRTDRNSLKLAIDGFGGEVAFCRLHGLEPDWTTTPRSNFYGTDPGDVVLRCGLMVDVKTRWRHHYDLVEPTWKKPVVDIYALMTGNLPNYVFRGFFWCHELCVNERLNDKPDSPDLGRGKGTVWLAFQKEMRTIDQIMTDILFGNQAA